MKDKKFMVVVEGNDGQTYFVNTNKKKEADECLTIFNNSANFVKISLYQKSGLGYECVASDSKRKVGFC